MERLNEEVPKTDAHADTSVTPPNHNHHHQDHQHHHSHHDSLQKKENSDKQESTTGQDCGEGLAVHRDQRQSAAGAAVLINGVTKEIAHKSHDAQDADMPVIELVRRGGVLDIKGKELKEELAQKVQTTELCRPPIPLVLSQCHPASETRMVQLSPPALNLPATRAMLYNIGQPLSTINGGYMGDQESFSMFNNNRMKRRPAPYEVEITEGGERVIQPWLTGIIAVIVFLILVFIAFLINRMWCENKEETNELEVMGKYTTTEHVNTNNMQCNENEYANDKSMQHNENQYASINGVQSNEYYTLKETMRSTEHSNAYDNIMAEEEVVNVIVTPM